MKDEKKDIVWRIRLIYIIVLFIALYIIYRLILVQFVDGDMWRQRAENLSLRYETVEAIRGSIISSDSNLLATSVPIFDIKIDLHKSVIHNDTFKLYLNELSDSLSQLFKDKSKDEFKQILLKGRKKGKRDLLLRRNIDYSQLKRLRTFPILKKGKYKGGFIIEEKDYRKMPFKMLASRTIGYKNLNSNAYVGLEGAYSKELEGISGKRLMRKIANGIWRPVERDNQIEPENGKDIITAIDINIQDVAQSALMKTLDSNDADHGCAILMEVNTGYIKAITNLKRHKDGTYGEDLNYAISETAEPGSTFKLASLIAVLEDGKFDTNELVNTGVCTYANKEMEDSHPEGYGRISLTKAFEVSSNVGISQIVYRTFNQNPQKFIDYLYDMNLNKPLGIDIKGEGNPYIKNTKDKNWSKLSLPWMSIGYELQLTPLQTLTLYNAVANNGVMVKPLFVKEILQTGKLIDKKKAVILNKSICSESTLRKVQSILIGVIEHGTAKHLQNTVYKIAGKTGTAKINYGKNKDSKVYRASFVGYFPADKPKYSCIVIISNPKKGQYYGGAIAAPVFKEIADKVYATELNIHQEKKIIYSKINIPFVSAGNQQDLFTIYSQLNLPFLTDNQDGDYLVSVKKDSLNAYRSKNYKEKIVPFFQGMGIKDAAYLAEKNGLKVNIVGKGKVVSQSVNQGTPIQKGQSITLYLASKGIDFNGIVSTKEILKDSINETNIKEKSGKVGGKTAIKKDEEKKLKIDKKKPEISKNKKSTEKKSSEKKKKTDSNTKKDTKKEQKKSDLKKQNNSKNN
jgi:cell division protein FtsI (penicillin-binding protein 3)